MGKARLIKGDCLKESDAIESGSVDLILTDLPYGTMEGQAKSGIYHSGQERHEWDNIIDTDKIMNIANRVLRKNGKMLLFAQEPFTNELREKAIPNLPYNYKAIWLKDTLGSFMRSQKALLYQTEDILLFSKRHDSEGLHPLRLYFKEVMNFIGLKLKQINQRLGHRRAEHTFYIDSSQFGLCIESTYQELIDVFGIDKMQGFKTYAELDTIEQKYKSTFNLWEGGKYKSNIFKYKKDYNGFHPTQKPILLLEDLIKTFSNEDNLIVDLTMGSGSTGVACINTNRNFIGIELDENYYKIAQTRIKEAQGRQASLLPFGATNAN